MSLPGISTTVDLLTTIKFYNALAPQFYVLIVRHVRLVRPPCQMADGSSRWRQKKDTFWTEDSFGQNSLLPPPPRSFLPRILQAVHCRHVLSHIHHQIMSKKIQAKTLDDIPSKFPLIQGKEVGKVRACDLSTSVEKDKSSSYNCTNTFLISSRVNHSSDASPRVRCRFRRRQSLLLQN